MYFNTLPIYIHCYAIVCRYICLRKLRKLSNNENNILKS